MLDNLSVKSRLSALVALLAMFMIAGGKPSPDFGRNQPRNAY